MVVKIVKKTVGKTAKLLRLKELIELSKSVEREIKVKQDEKKKIETRIEKLCNLIKLNQNECDHPEEVIRRSAGGAYFCMLCDSMRCLD